MLEFVTLVVVRIREPGLKREFRVPGGILGCVMVGVFPFALLLLSLVKSSSETVLGMNGLFFGAIIIASGFTVYAATSKLRSSDRRAPAGAVEST